MVLAAVHICRLLLQVILLFLVLIVAMANCALALEMAEGDLEGAETAQSARGGYGGGYGRGYGGRGGYKG
ncbi:hypothetical protein J6590_083423 [Homalodisca vitripennis]|nr:hypothetical protein J6590_083423 [Homalodisca vitripennis]